MYSAAELRSDECSPLEYLELPLNMLRRDGETQARTSLNAEVVEEYAELMLAGIDFPPVRACSDGEHYWLTDGFHRVAAAERSHAAKIRVEAFSGTLTDAQWDSCRANSGHGLRRTPEDLRLVVARAVRHERSAKLSNYELARFLQVSEKTIRRLRSQISTAQAVDERIALRNGREYKIRTAQIGKTRKAEKSREREVCATLERRLAADLLAMDREATPDVRRILLIFRNWTQRAPNPLNVLQALEGLVADLKTDRISPARFR